MGVVAALAALVIMSGKGVQRKTDQAVCASHLKQIGMATLQFVIENNRMFPGPLVGRQPASYSRKSTDSLLYYIAPQLGLPAPGEKAIHSSLFECPAVMRAVRKGTPDIRSYSQNTALFGYLLPPPPQLPSQPVSLNSVDSVKSLATTYCLTELMPIQNSLKEPAHDKRLFVFLDGHIELREYP